MSSLWCRVCNHLEDGKQENEFIEIEGHFTMTEKNEYPYPDERRTISLHACPECHTVKMREW